MPARLLRASVKVERSDLSRDGHPRVFLALVRVSKRFGGVPAVWDQRSSDEALVVIQMFMNCSVRGLMKAKHWRD